MKKLTSPTRIRTINDVILRLSVTLGPIMGIIVAMGACNSNWR